MPQPSRCGAAGRRQQSGRCPQPPPPRRRRRRRPEPRALRRARAVMCPCLYKTTPEPSRWILLPAARLRCPSETSSCCRSALPRSKHACLAIASAAQMREPCSRNCAPRRLFRVVNRRQNTPIRLSAIDRIIIEPISCRPLPRQVAELHAVADGRSWPIHKSRCNRPAGAGAALRQAPPASHPRGQVERVVSWSFIR